MLRSLPNFGKRLQQFKNLPNSKKLAYTGIGVAGLAVSAFILPKVNNWVQDKLSPTIKIGDGRTPIHLGNPSFKPSANDLGYQEIQLKSGSVQSQGPESITFKGASSCHATLYPRTAKGKPARSQDQLSYMVLDTNCQGGERDNRIYRVNMVTPK